MLSGLTVSVTGTSNFKPLAVNSMLLVYWPVARAAVLNDAAILEGVVPPEGFTLIQFAPVTAAVHAMDPEPVMPKFTLAGLYPAMALRFSCEGLTEIVAGENDHTGPLLVAVKPTMSTRQ